MDTSKRNQDTRKKPKVIKQNTYEATHRTTAIWRNKDYNTRQKNLTDITTTTDTLES